MTEITLNKNTCLEELTYAWCLSSCWTERGIYFYKPKKKQKPSICFREYDEGRSGVCAEDIAEFYPHNQKLVIHNMDKFEPFLQNLKLNNESSSL